MEKELQNLGFSPNQAKVYLALLELGQSTVGPIVKKTGLHRQVIYNTLAELEKLDLLQSTIKNNRQNYAIIDTQKIVENFKKKQALAEELIPELMSKQKKSAAAQEIKIYEGIEGFQIMHLNNIKIQPANSTYYILGAAGPAWINIMQQNNFLPKYEKVRLEKNIKVELIGFEDTKNQWEKITREVSWQSKRDLKIFKYLPTSYNNPVGIEIWHDRVSLITYTEPILVIDIKNINFVKSFKTYFDKLWEQSSRDKQSS